MGLGEREVGVIMAGDARRRPGARVQVASIDTLRNRPKPFADLVFVDECHRALAPSYKALQSYYKHSTHIGLTATPYRADGKGLGDAYDELVVVASPRELIDGGYLVEPAVFTVPEARLPDLSGVRTRRGDYDAKQLAEAVDKSALVGNLVTHWQQHAAGLRTIAFAASVKHSMHIAEQFRRAGVAAEHLDGETPKRERAAILARLGSGETQLVSNVGVLCEGFDEPSAKCAILARPTKSTGLYLQMAGRILRPWEGVGAVVLDHAGCARNHGLPQETRSFELEAKNRDRKRTLSSPPVKVCEGCYQVVHPSVAECPHCGWAFPRAPAVPQEVDGLLVPLEERTWATGGTPRQREIWNECCRVAMRKGYKPGWVWFEYQKRLGVKPPVTFKLPGPRSSEERSRNITDQLRDAARAGRSVSWEALA